MVIHVEIEIPSIGTDKDEDITRLHAEGYGVDDDNEAASENVPNQRAKEPSLHFSE